mgnify:CR=1 FL=1
MVVWGRGWNDGLEWEWQLSSDSLASMLAAATSQNKFTVKKLFLLYFLTRVIILIYIVVKHQVCSAWIFLANLVAFPVEVMGRSSFLLTYMSIHPLTFPPTYLHPPSYPSFIKCALTVNILCQPGRNPGGGGGAQLDGVRHQLRQHPQRHPRPRRTRTLVTS